jgi:hypothetical protein
VPSIEEDSKVLSSEAPQNIPIDVIVSSDPVPVQEEQPEKAVEAELKVEDDKKDEGEAEIQQDA